MEAVSTVVLLEPACAISANRLAGRSVHGWFLDQVRCADASAGSVLHANLRHKPFTVSPAYCAESGRSGLWWLRVTSIFTPLSEWLLTWRAEAMSEVRLGDSRFRVLQVTTDASQHPWAGRAKLAVDVPAPHPVLRRVRLHFHTPTAFSGEHGATLFPEPRLVYRSLAAKWNEYGAPALDPAAVDTFCSNLQVEGYQLQTAVVPGVRRLEKGFTGHLDVSLIASAPVEAAAWLDRLSGFALFAGVGQKTTMGMGQVTAERSR